MGREISWELAYIFIIEWQENITSTCWKHAQPFNFTSYEENYQCTFTLAPLTCHIHNTDILNNTLLFITNIKVKNIVSNYSKDPLYEVFIFIHPNLSVHGPKYLLLLPLVLIHQPEIFIFIMTLDLPDRV